MEKRIDSNNNEDTTRALVPLLNNEYNEFNKVILDHEWNKLNRYSRNELGSCVRYRSFWFRGNEIQSFSIKEKFKGVSSIELSRCDFGGFKFILVKVHFLNQFSILSLRLEYPGFHVIKADHAEKISAIQKNYVINAVKYKKIKSSLEIVNRAIENFFTNDSYSQIDFENDLRPKLEKKETLSDKIMVNAQSRTDLENILIENKAVSNEIQPSSQAKRLLEEISGIEEKQDLSYGADSLISEVKQSPTDENCEDEDDKVDEKSHTNGAIEELIDTKSQKERVVIKKNKKKSKKKKKAKKDK